MSTNTTAITHSNSNKTSPVISSHYSKALMATTGSGVMMKANDSPEYTPSSNDLSFDDGVDIDLQEIPSFIIDLQQNQPTLNIMTCGDVSHGKSTLLNALSGEKTGKHSEDLKRNMTIRLGYTSCKIWKCLLCSPLSCYFTTHSDEHTKNIMCSHCGSHYIDGDIILLRHISFVDVPGHAQLMQTMVSATSVADAAILVIDASKPCPGKQTAQHLDAVNLLGLMKQGHLIIAQNKIDLVNPTRACQSHQEIRRYLSSFGDDGLTYNTPIIPISAQSKLNIDALCHCIVHCLPKYSNKLMEYECSRQSLKTEELYMNIIRSFDVNRAKDISRVKDIDRITGGVLGGAVLNGHIEIGQKIEIRPGYIIKKKLKKYATKTENKLQPQWEAQPIQTTVKSLKYGKNDALSGYPGGNVGVETNIDPSLTKSDRMCGHIVIDANHPRPPPIFNKFVMSYSFINGREKAFKKFETVRLNIGSFKMAAEIIEGDVAEYGGVLCVLEAPICGNIGDCVGICRSNKKKEWSFVGGGIIRKTKNIVIRTDKDKLLRIKSMNKVEIGNMDICDRKEHIHLSYQQRNSKKGVTMIVGLPIKINLKKLMKKMKKKWNTGATIVEDKDKGNVMQIQGDLRHEILEWFVKLDIVEKSQITIHGY